MSLNCAVVQAFGAGGALAVNGSVALMKKKAEEIKAGYCFSE